MRALGVLDSRYNSYKDMFTDEELEQILEPTSKDPSEIISYAYSAHMLSHVLTHGDKWMHKFLDDDCITEPEIDEVP